MKTTIVTRARSPLGTLVALLLVTAVLVMMGMYLVTNGGFFTKFGETLANLGAAKSVLQTVQDNLKQYDRPQLITGYALLIVMGAAAVGVMGSFIRTNQYRFIGGADVVEKRGLWLYVPACVLVWAVLTGLLMVCDRWAVAGVLQKVMGPGVYEKAGWGVMPLMWLCVSGAIAWAALWTLWRRVERWLGRSLCVPGLRRRVPFSKVKRMEIQNSGEGSTVLVLVLANGAAWTIQAGRVKRLQRLGAVLSRRLGLERRDFVTWA